jgi:transcriptional regulator with XRE-family HTH domain
MGWDQASPPFALVLRQLREAAGLSHEDLAVRAGLRVEEVRRLERGPRPRPSAVGSLADALGLPPGVRREAFFAAADAVADEAPAERSRRVLPSVLAGAALLVAVCAVAGLLLVLRAGQTAAGGPLQVAGAGVRVDGGAVRHCPTATFTFHGTVDVGQGAGTLTYHWVRPDGTIGPAASLQVPAGTHEVDVALLFQYEGSQPASGDATLDVTAPVHVTSAPLNVMYACP